MNIKFSFSITAAFQNPGETLDQFEQRLLTAFRDLHQRHLFEVRRAPGKLIVIDLIYGTEWDVPLTRNVREKHS